jgi:hypothetical protein
MRNYKTGRNLQNNLTLGFFVNLKWYLCQYVCYHAIVMYTTNLCSIHRQKEGRWVGIGNFRYFGFGLNSGFGRSLEMEPNLRTSYTGVVCASFSCWLLSISCLQVGHNFGSKLLYTVNTSLNPTQLKLAWNWPY